MPNVFGLGMSDTDVQLLVELLKQFLPDEKPTDVVITWCPHDKRVHSHVDIRGSSDCTPQTLSLVAQACREAGLDPKPGIYTPSFYPQHPSMSGWGIPQFMDEIGSFVDNVKHHGISMHCSTNARVVNLLGKDAPYVELVAQGPNGLGAEGADCLAEQLAEAAAKYADVECYWTKNSPRGNMTFIPKAG